MRPQKILILSQDQLLRQKLNQNFADKYKVLLAAELTTLYEIIQKEKIDLFILNLIDIKDLAELNNYLASCGLGTEVLIVADPQLQSEVIRKFDLERFHFLTKPLPADGGKSLVEKILLKKYLQQENQDLFARIKNRFWLGEFIAEGAFAEAVLNKIEQVLNSPEPILISGEPGTEKDILAYEIYKNNQNFKGPFLKKNISRTGALDDISFIYEANYGFLILEDIGTLNAEDQKKLKGLLLEHTVNLRFILFSSVDLARRVKDNLFDRQLYELINKAEIQSVPLRERIKDLPEIAEKYLNLLNEYTGFKLTNFTDQAILALSKYSWPGNLAQLRAVIYATGYAKQSGTIELEDLPLFFWQPDEQQLQEAILKH